MKTSVVCVGVRISGILAVRSFATQRRELLESSQATRVMQKREKRKPRALWKGANLCSQEGVAWSLILELPTQHPEGERIAPSSNSPESGAPAGVQSQEFHFLPDDLEYWIPVFRWVSGPLAVSGLFLGNGCLLLPCVHVRMCVCNTVSGVLLVGSRVATGCTDNSVARSVGAVGCLLWFQTNFLTLGVFWKMRLQRSVKARASYGVANMAVYLAQPEIPM